MAIQCSMIYVVGWFGLVAQQKNRFYCLWGWLEGGELLPVEFRTCSHTAGNRSRVLRHALFALSGVSKWVGWLCYPNSVWLETYVRVGWGVVMWTYTLGAGCIGAAGFRLTISDIWVIACEFRRANNACVRAWGPGKLESFPADSTWTTVRQVAHAINRVDRAIGEHVLVDREWCWFRCSVCDQVVAVDWMVFLGVARVGA